MHKMMFTFALVILIVSTVIPDGVQGMSISSLMKMKEMMKNICKSETGVEQELLTKAKEGEFSDDEKFKCYLKCCLEMMQTIKNNKINVETATKQVEMFLPEDLKDPTLKQLNACKDSVGSNTCDLAYQFTVCSYKNNKDNFLIPV